MKTLLSSVAFAGLFFLFLANPLPAQVSKKGKKEAAIKALIDAQYFTFEPQTAIPLKMKIQNLSSGFDLKVSKDAIEAYLPYYGRVYIPTVGITKSPLDFKTTTFKYEITPSKKGGWDITITPKNVGDTRQLVLSVAPGGNASLQATFTSRDQINFNGHIH
jgi:hypothetical protein